MSQAKTADRRQMDYCSRGHDLRKTRRRTPKGQSYCTECKREYCRARRRHPATGPRERPPVDALALLRDGLVLDATSPEMFAWQRRVFAFFGAVAQGRVA